MRIIHDYGKELLCGAMLGVGIYMDYNTSQSIPEWVRITYFSIAWMLVGVKVAYEGWEELREGEIFNEFTLMLIASAGAFAIGEYPEAIAVMLFYCVGEKMQDAAADKARDNITALMDLRPDSATVVRSGEEETCRAEEVSVGEVIRVHCGERVPLDGKLTQGEATFDTSAITGESKPTNIRANEGNILAGMIPTDRAVEIEVTKPYAESALSRIMQMVEEASDRKAPAELFIRKFAKIYTPAVCGIALLIALCPWIWALATGGSYVFADWFYRALVFLVVSCPCALVISIPLGYFGGIGAASTKGILFKGGNYLDEITQIDCVAFDKTGTLTTGVFAVREVSSTGADILPIVAAIEQTTTHPIGRAIVEHAQKAGCAQAAIQDVREIAGQGLEGQQNGERVLVGNMRLMQSNGVEVPTDIANSEDLTVLCSIGGQYAGCITMEDTPKENAQEAMHQLAEEGIKRIVVLSGDKQSIVTRLTCKMGNDVEGYGDLMPEQKMDYIRTKMSQGSHVAFAGDGINDAPALATSNLGIAMGGMGSDVAIEAAGVVIQDDDPGKIATAIKIGRATRSIVYQNIILALGVKAIVMLLGSLGLVGLWAAVFADVGVALICVANAMRISGMTDRKAEKRHCEHKHEHEHCCCGHHHHHH